MRHNLAYTLVAVTALMGACSGRDPIEPTHAAQITLAPNRYEDLITELDRAMLGSGLKRFGPAPALNELRGREVLYIEYRLEPSDRFAVVSATDVSAAGIVQVRFYPTALHSEQQRHDAMSRLNCALVKFGARLDAVTPDTRRTSRGRIYLVAADRLEP